MTFLTQPGKNPFEPISLIIGIVAFLSGLLYFLDKYAIVNISYEIPNETLLIFFPVMALVCGLVLIFSTIGMFGVR